MVKMPHWPICAYSNIIDFGLERVRELLSKVGNPHLNLPPVIHVAGTNGKGSTLAFLKSIFEEAGYSVHRYISPHLVNFNERICLKGQDISDSYLFEILEECRIAAEKNNIKVTFFEGTTVAAFLAFSRIEADILLLETGMGGRLDATNVIENPLINIITPISLDHIDYLGNTLEKIAYEKAGILKRGAKAVFSLQEDEVEQVLESRAKELDMEVYSFGYDFGLEIEDNKFIYQSHKRNITLPFPSLQGEHQLINAATAITAAINSPNFKIEDEHIISAMTKTSWPVRLQKLDLQKLKLNIAPNFEIWLDGAHNVSGSHVLSLWLENQQNESLYFIVGMTRGRDIKAFLTPISKYIDYMCGIYIKAEPSSYKSEKVKEVATSMDINADTCDDIEDAISKIQIYHRNNGRKERAKIIFCGSLFLSGWVLDEYYQ